MVIEFSMFDLIRILKSYIFIFTAGYIVSLSFSLAQNQDFPEHCDEFYNSSCYTYFNNTKKNWQEANSDCISRGGYLTSIYSEQENRLLSQLVNLNKDEFGVAWIGLKEIQYNQTSNWEDGTPVTYTKEIRNIGIIFNADQCLAIPNYESQWIKFDCGHPFSYICKQEGSVFGKMDHNSEYTEIKDKEKINITNLSKLICRTDTDESATEIIWEYRYVETSNWTRIGGEWNSSTGISTVIPRNGSGYYRCNIRVGGVKKVYTADSTNDIEMMISGTMTTNTPIPTTATTTNSPISFRTTTETMSIQTISFENTTAEPTTPGTNILIFIAVGATVGVLIIVIILIVTIILLVLFKTKRRKPKEYQYISNVKYSNSLSLAIKPTMDKKKVGRLTYQNLSDLTAGIEITEKELMEALEDSKMEIPETVYNRDYVNVADLHVKPESNYEEIGDPKMAPISLDVYKTYLKQLWKKEGALEEEYKSLGGVSLRYPCENAVLAHNIPKNKYKMIYPYDKSRILLTPINEDPNTTYINASYIPGVYTYQYFIATQGPMENTVEDFWRLVVENNIENIVMVTNIIEGNRKKCEMYFPIDTTNSETFGEYKISLEKSEIFPGHIIRHLRVEIGQKTIHVNQYHFTAWPDHDVPLVFDDFISFVRKTHENMKHTKSSVLVHCSAGVGRSGTFITLYNIMSAIENSKPISIYKIVHQMREHRPQMVQTFRQYKFIYLAVSEMLFQDTAIAANEFTTTYEQYKQTDLEGYESFLTQQFDELTFQTENSLMQPSEVGSNKENEPKNPQNCTIPYDENRVMLVPVNDGNDYINASYMMNLNFIATVHPKVNTLADFLQMIYQTGSTLVIMLTTRKEKGEIEGRMSQRSSYWGKMDESKEIPPFTVTNTHSEKSTTMIKQTLTITNNKDGFSTSVKQIISLAWSDKGEPNDLSNIILLIQTMMKYKQENPNLPIIVHCSDGIGRTGVLLTTYKIIEEIDNKESIDIFHTIKHLRNDRMKIVPSLAHFLSCFALINEYCSTTI